MLLLNAQAKWLTVHLLKMQIKTKDEVVRRVLAKMDQRSLIGQEKYGATMMGEIKNEVKDLDRFLVDVQEELMDALLYIEAARYCLGDEIEEAMLKRMNIISRSKKITELLGQNGNDGLHYDKEEV